MIVSAFLAITSSIPFIASLLFSFSFVTFYNFYSHSAFSWLEFTVWVSSMIYASFSLFAWWSSSMIFFISAISLIIFVDASFIWSHYSSLLTIGFYSESWTKMWSSACYVTVSIVDFYRGKSSASYGTVSIVAFYRGKSPTVSMVYSGASHSGNFSYDFFSQCSFGLNLLSFMWGSLSM